MNIRTLLRNKYALIKVANLATFYFILTQAIYKLNTQLQRVSRNIEGIFTIVKTL